MKRKAIIQLYKLENGGEQEQEKIEPNIKNKGISALICLVKLGMIIFIN